MTIFYLIGGGFIGLICLCLGTMYICGKYRLNEDFVFIILVLSGIILFVMTIGFFVLVDALTK